MRRVLAVLAVLVLLAAVAAGLLWRDYQDFLATPLEFPDQGYVLQVADGASARAVINRLEQAGFTRFTWRWRLLMRLEPTLLQAGEFRFSGGVLPRSVLEAIASGRVVHYPFTLVEGWNWREVLQALEADEVLERPEGWRQAAADLVDGPPEGQFLPETYLFVRGDSAVDVLVRARQAMVDALAEAWQSRAVGLPLETPYELQVLASIIEKETAIDSEREQIAGVFVRRLQQGMRLQADPTVIYGLGESFDGDIRSRDLRSDTPYNTYTRHGLPPTPIAMPSRRSLEAAAQPDSGSALYFVADGKGGHTFSTTLEEHNKAVKKLIGKP